MFLETRIFGERSFSVVCRESERSPIEKWGPPGGWGSPSHHCQPAPHQPHVATEHCQPASQPRRAALATLHSIAHEWNGMLPLGTG